MKTTKHLMQSGVLALSMLATSVMAAVSADEAAKLGTSLTPVGAEKAGNADGSIPEWTGGLPKDAGQVDGKGFLSNPYANEKPLFTITAQNVDQYKDKLTPGQLAMFKRYPDTYKMPVYTTHRSATLPQNVLEDTKHNAANTKLVEGGNGLENFKTANPFPMPQNGLEAVWNQITRYRGGSDEFVFPTSMTDYDPNKGSNILFYFKQRVTAPSRLAGNVLLVHETLNQ
ncbi:UNVERIFIED_CONTAM: hypothetical protein NCL1_62799, partial [Trichonephila clavipes]